jgi:hypothetical protein
MTTLYYYVCDNCGTFADITETQHPEGSGWICGDCDSEALWEFTDKDKAWVHGARIRDSRFAAQMAGLDQARARLDEMEGKS